MVLPKNLNCPYHNLKFLEKYLMKSFEHLNCPHYHEVLLSQIKGCFDDVP